MITPSQVFTNLTFLNQKEPSIHDHTNTGRIQFSGLILLACVILAIFAATPVLAGTMYLTGSPNLTASIVGSNEFTPGTTIPFTIQVQNDGRNTMKFVQTGIVERDDNPSTAKMVKVSLLPGDSPALIKSDPQMIGDVAGSASIPAKFEIWIPDDAKAGRYSLPVVLDYTYLASAEQEGTDNIAYRYVGKKVTLEMPFVIKSAINLAVTHVQADGINAGGSGYVTLTLQNNGTNSGERAVAKLSKSENSPILPVDSSVFIGTFEPGQSVDTRFRVSVSEDADAQKYPLNVQITYNNENGETLDTPGIEFGVPVGSKTDFTITSPPAEMNQGQKSVIDVVYRNDGSAPVYYAEVRLSAVDPFTSNDDLAYLGDLKPGETGVAHFQVSVDSGATIKSYGLDSEVKYRDALDDSQVSDTIKVPITITPNQGLGSLLGNPIVIGVLLIVIIGLGYFTYNKRKTIPAR
ncbi:MAG: S-layer protein [Methanomicrobiales archaeon]|mgnify:CR=1 FL=1|nr:S-layer protein [Methanomicrobiales archaeon]